MIKFTLEEIKEFKRWRQFAKYKQENRFMQAGNEIQICSIKMLGIRCIERTYFPYNILKEPVTSIIPDLVLPMETVIEGAYMSDKYYTDKGYGMPVFEKYEYVYKYLKQLKNANNN